LNACSTHVNHIHNTHMPSSAFIRLAAYHCTVTAIPHLVTASPLALDFANTYTPCRKHRTTIFVCAICCMPLPSKPPAAVNTNRCRQHQQQRCAATQRLQGGGAGKAGFSWPHTITTLHTAPSHHHHHHYSTHTAPTAGACHPTAVPLMSGKVSWRTGWASVSISGPVTWSSPILE